MNVEIRSLAERDVPRALEIVRLNDPGIPQLLARDLDAWLRHGDREREHYFVAETAADVVALQGYQPDRWGVADVFWLVWAYVDPAWQRRGISSALLASIERRLAALRCRKLYLDVGNEGEHRAAIAFHLSRGFRHEGALRDFWRDGEDFLIFAKRLVGSGGDA